MNPQTTDNNPQENPDISPGTTLDGYNEGDTPPATTPGTTYYKPPKRVPKGLAILIGIVVILIIVGSLAYAFFASTRQMTTPEASNYNQQAIDLAQINDTNMTSNSSSQLAVNGALSVSGSFQIAPNAKPLNPTSGQIFFDKERSALSYYNGSEFVYLQGGGTSVQNIDNSTSTTTIINNATQLAPPSVLLQQGTPSTVQLGNFNINGTGTISNLTSENATINTGNVTNLSSTTANIGTGNINALTADTANVETGNVNTANIEVGNITTGNIETGNIDVGNIGVVNTTQIESGGNSFAINQYEPIPGGQAATAGYTSVGSSTTMPVGMFGTKVNTGSSGGPLDSVSVYLGNAYQYNTISGASGPAANASFEIGIYSDDGDLVSNKPQTLLAQAGPFYANDGDFTLNSWNTLDMPSLPLQSFTGYWIVFKVLGSWSSYNAIEFKYKTNSNDGNSYTFTDQSWCSWAAWGMPANGPLQTCFGGTGPYYNKSDLSAYLNYTTDPSTGGAGAMFSLSPTGQASFRATEDSLNAFKVQNAASATTIFNIDTYNMRVAIGKPTADYLLDIGNGDVNMVNGRSLRFGGVKVLTASATATALAGGTITLQGATTLSSTATIQGAASFASTMSVTGAATFTGAAALNNTVTNKVTSPTAFRVQNASSVDLFVADTTNRVITVKGVDATYASLTLQDAHFKSSQTTAPTIATPANCGTTPTATVTTNSTDSAGSFTITTGTGGTSSTCDATITFRRAYGTAPKSIIVIGKSTAPAAQRGIYVSTATTAGFTVSFANSTGGADNTAYSFSYWVIE